MLLFLVNEDNLISLYVRMIF